MTQITPDKSEMSTRTRCILIKSSQTTNEDWYRMVWATFKPFTLIFSSLTIILLMANLIYYQQRWTNGYKPEQCVKLRTCLVKVNSTENLEILVPMLRNNQTLIPLVHHFIVVTSLCLTTLFGNIINDFSLSYYPAYALSVVWTHEHYHNFRIILDSASILYNLAHLTHFLTAISALVFAASVVNKRYRKREVKKLITRKAVFYSNNSIMPIPE